MNEEQAIGLFDAKLKKVERFIHGIPFSLSDCETFRVCDGLDTKYKKTRPSPKIIKGNELYDYLKGCFAHHTASKSRKYKYDLLYTFPSEDIKKQNIITEEFNENDNTIWLNLSYEWVKNDILPFLTKLSKKVRKASEKFHALNDARFFLLGEPGIGKTIFINYLLSSYHTDFDSANCIYIRVDLTKSFTDDL